MNAPLSGVGVPGFAVLFSAYVYIEKAYGNGQLPLADELFANIDLDTEESRDPMCHGLRSDSRIVEGLACQPRGLHGQGHP